MHFSIFINHLNHSSVAFRQTVSTSLIRFIVSCADKASLPYTLVAEIFDDIARKTSPNFCSSSPDAQIRLHPIGALAMSTTPRVRRSAKALMRFGDLLRTRQPGVAEDIRERCGELWLTWSAEQTLGSLSGRSSSLSGLVDVWENELATSALSPLSPNGLEEYVRHRLLRGMSRTSVWMSLSYLKRTLEDLRLASPEIRATIRRLNASDAVKTSSQQRRLRNYRALRPSDVRATVAAADPGSIGRRQRRFYAHLV